MRSEKISVVEVLGNFSLMFENRHGGAWPAESVEHVTLDLRVMSSSPTLGGHRAYLKRFKKKIRVPGWLSRLGV